MKVNIEARFLACYHVVPKDETKKPYNCMNVYVADDNQMQHFFVPDGIFEECQKLKFGEPVYIECSLVNKDGQTRLYFSDWAN